jgi:phage terminase large subunit-like protein
VVIERNAGGELLENFVKLIDDKIKIKSVYASLSKISRAEPIVILYQKRMIFHSKQFHKLEMQMVTYEPRSKSPDRLDALVWAMSELFCVNSFSKIPTVWKM